MLGDIKKVETALLEVVEGVRREGFELASAALVQFTFLRIPLKIS